MNSSNNYSNKTVEIEDFSIEGYLLKWKDASIQISNISMIAAENLNPPPFPINALWLILAGLAGMALGYNEYYDDFSALFGIGLILLIIAGFWIAVWVSQIQDAQKYKYLRIYLNSGTVYSLLFRNEVFLNKVLTVLSAIFKKGVTEQTHYTFNINGGEIRNVGHVEVMRHE